MLKKLPALMAACLFLLCLGGPDPARALDEAKVAARAKVIRSAWDNALYQGLELMCTAGAKSWYVRKLSLRGRVVLDIKKQKKGPFPYLMSLTFRAVIKDNASSPEADSQYSKFAKRSFFFKTPKEARAHMAPRDMRSFGVRHFSLHYAYCKNRWQHKGGNKLFKDFVLKEARHVKQNSKFWKTVKIPPQK